MARLVQYFWTIAEQLPSLLAMVGGIVFALTRWKRNPRISKMVALGLALMIVHVFVFLLVYDFVPPIFLRNISATTTSYEEASRISRKVYLVLGLIFHGLLAIPFALLLAAVFMRRNEPDEVTQGQS